VPTLLVAGSMTRLSQLKWVVSSNNERQVEFALISNTAHFPLEDQLLTYKECANSYRRSTQTQLPEQINRIGADEVLTANQAGGRIMSSLAALTAASTMGKLA